MRIAVSRNARTSYWHILTVSIWIVSPLVQLYGTAVRTEAAVLADQLRPIHTAVQSDAECDVHICRPPIQRASADFDTSENKISKYLYLYD